MNKYEEILNIIEKRTHIGTMSRDYGKTVDDVLTINNAHELIMLEEALEQAKKEHELLELYREYHIVLENSEFYKRLYTSLLESNRDYHDDYLSYKRCEEDKDKIMERIIKLEDELKV
jgi:hypothetical protein